MGRKKKGADVQTRLNTYLKDYELDELNKSNDLASLIQMCQLEVNIAKLNDHISKLDPSKDSKIYKDLIMSLRDATNSYTTLQDQLGIARKKRASEGEETPLSYIEKLKSQAKQIVDKKLHMLICPKCSIVLGKYHVYITQRGEPKSLAYKDKPIEQIKYIFTVECSKCGALVTTDSKDKLGIIIE